MWDSNHLTDNCKGFYCCGGGLADAHAQKLPGFLVFLDMKWMEVMLEGKWTNDR